MAKIEQLTCPACGAHEVKSIGGVNYQCDYCHSTFIVKADNPFHKFNFDPDIFSSQNVETINQMKITAVKPVKLFVVIMVAVALIGVGVASFVLTTVSNATKSTSTFFGDWQKPNIDNYNCLVGSKGAVVWLVLKTQTNKLDSVKYLLRLIDPITKKIMVEEPLGKPKAWKELFNQSKQFDNDFYVANDTAYNISEDGGIQGFDLYTGKRLFGNEWFQSKFQQLKDGISKIDKQYYKKRVKLTSAAGDDLYYYLDSKLLIGEKEDEKAERDKPVFTEEIYLSQNKKSQLYLCNKQRRSNESYYISDSYIEQFKERSSYMRTYIKSIKPIGEALYAKALPINEYNNNLLFFYASDFSKNADGVLALVNKEGNFAWKNTDTTFKKIVKENTSDNIYLNYNLNKDLLVININNSGHQSVGVDLKTGKTKFVFKQSYSID
ncbi:MAG: hypothetical protein H0U95_07185 [Bacteroidetes bacterium]|nr:hypothetical protein [Bacteroidota bacterium]